MIHYARTMPFADLHEELAKAMAAGLIFEKELGDLRLYCYTRTCAYDRLWTPVAMAARGLITNPREKRVVATPFMKFFNVGERADPIPALPFETFEKLDGSLIILFHFDGAWRAATKGSFKSDQAVWAAEWMARHDLSALDTGTTYLAEAIYPENRIVIRYNEAALVLLAAFSHDGRELAYSDLSEVARKIGWRAARRHEFNSVADLIIRAEGLTADEEGFVLRFENGLRLKIKGEEYRRIHALISRITPLAMWEALQAGDDMETIRQQLPEEFWTDFDRITTVLNDKIAATVAAVELAAAPVLHMSDKEVGLMLGKFDDAVRPFIFPYRKSGGKFMEGRSRRAVFRSIRPTGNNLPGYTPSYAMNRVSEESI